MFWQITDDILANTTRHFGKYISVYAQALSNVSETPIHYYRDSDGLEVDVIIELPDGRWGAIEIKLGHNKADEAASNLRRLAKKISANPVAQNPKLSFLAVCVGKSEFKYRLDDVVVFPITCLAP